MLIWIGVLVLLVLVEGYKENICPRRDPPPGVLVLTPGNQVLLHCHGDVIVDSVLKVKGQTERPLLRAYQQNERTTSDDTYRTPTAESSTATYHTETVKRFPEAHHETTDGTSLGKYQKGKEMTSTYRHHDSNGVTTPGVDRYESTEETLPGEHERETAGSYQRRVGDASKTGSDIDKPSDKTESDTLDVKKNGYSATERPQMTANTAAEVTHPPILTDNFAEVGGAVNLKRRSYWTLNGVPVQGGTESVLMLPHLGPKDLGNYSCYRQGALLSSVKITFGTPPERPILSCYRRSPESKIRCDWTSPQPVDPTPKCHILLQKSRQLSQVMCTYSVLHSRCWCVLNHEEDRDWGSRSVYTAKLCVTNTAGNATSPEIRFTGENCIKPDPPASVRASGVEGGEHMLDVSWAYPASWRRGFYFLRFQLRYRPSLGETYQTVETQTLSWAITDALPHTEYELQVRAIEEFNNGRWSDWTTPVYACTWTTLESTTTSQSDDNLETLWLLEGSGSGEITVEAAVSGDSLDVFGTMFGVCLLAVMVILLSVYVFRHRMRFASTLGKLGSSPASGGSDPPAVCPQMSPLEEEKPLMSPVSPTPSQVTMQDHFLPDPEKNDQNIHFHNMGYFLVSKE